MTLGEEFTIPSLTDFVEGDRGEMLLCAIRASRKYLSRTKQYHPASGNAFVLTTEAKKWVSQDTISFLDEIVY